MKRIRFQHHDSSRLALAALAAAVLILAGNRVALAGEAFVHVKGIEGFSSLVATRSLDAVSISDAESAGAGGAERLAWGQAMLEDLERLQNSVDAGDWARIEDAFAFRDWCIGAPGRGNLLLAIAAEETAVSLLFQTLAEDQKRGEEVRSRFVRCLRNGLSADYWLETLAMEGIVVDCGDALTISTPEYARLGIVFQTLFAMLGGWGNPLNVPNRDGTWNGCTEAFAPMQLAFRTSRLLQKEIGLEVCLDILDTAGIIPDERTAFVEVADKYASATLRKRDRATSWTTAGDVWDYWAAALAEVQKK